MDRGSSASKRLMPVNELAVKCSTSFSIARWVSRASGRSAAVFSMGGGLATKEGIC